MGIVRFALRLPHTFYVLAALVLFLGATAVLSMPTDIFPEIDIPVVTIIWQYTGLSTPEMEQRVTTYSQYALSSSVNGIRDIEAQTINGISVQKVFFQPDVNLDLAISQIVSATNFIRLLMPPGIQAPVVVQYNASSVPVLQIGLSSDTLNEQQLYDYGIYRLRQQLAPIHGVTLPTPAGGKYRQIMVDIDPLKLQAKGLTPLDVVNAVNAQNLTLPSGTAKIGDTQFTVRTNAVPTTIEDLNNIPVKFVNGATVFVKDVGQVHDGNAVQQNIVRTDGRRSVLLSIIKNGNASTLAVVNGVKQALVVARAAAPSGMQIKELFDQSVFVKASIQGLLKEGAIAACLTALMIVLFLGSWRSTLVVMISIPLSILSSLVVLYFLGDTINTMTLGGLALAIGILVDDSTVTIENTHRLLTEERMPLPSATLHGAAGIAVPTLVSTLAISCVFVSVVFLHGPAKYLFTPLGLAVVFAMLASYGFSRTLTPITIGLLLKGERHGEEASHGWFARLFAKFERAFETMRNGYTEILHTLLRRRIIVPLIAAAVLALGRHAVRVRRPRLLSDHRRRPNSAARARPRRNPDREDRADLSGGRGQDPRGHSGRRARADRRQYRPAGPLLQLCLRRRDGDRRQRRRDPGRAEGGPRARPAGYISKLREVLPAAFPEDVFYFQAADMVTQILNFGIPAQINVRTVGYDRTKNLRIAKELRQRIAAIPGVADAHLQQEVSAPEFFAQIDRARATQFGLTATSIALNLNTSLSSSEQVSPNFWTDPSNGTPYYLAVQTPEYRVNSLNELKNTPVTTFTTTGPNPVPGLLSNVASLKRDSVPTNANQANIQPVYEIYANAEGRDLGSISGDINKIVAEYQKQLSPGNRIEVIGQIDSMNAAFRDLAIGILFAAVFVYLLMVVNYQNWGDPFVVILALPATFCGIVTMLYVTGTTLSVPSLMGAIMAIGVASANSILLVTFAREQQLAGMRAFDAAIAAGRTRIRPVLMTAAAMIVGMIPMAIGGAGEEQNAALARAVIGGLLFATPTTLLVVPYLFAMLRKGNDGKPAHGVFAEDPQ